MRLYGVTVTRSDTREARRLLATVSNIAPSHVEPLDLFTTYAAVKERTTGARPRIVLELMADPASCPRCVCGRSAVSRFNASGAAQACDEGWDCPRRAADTAAKRVATSRERYGVDNPAQSAVVQRKMASTNTKCYGAPNAFASEAIKERIRRTNMERYGVEHSMQVPETRAKVVATNLARRGVEAPAQDPAVRRKMRATMRKRYGVDNPSQSARIMRKMRRTLRKNYGVDNPGKSPVIQARIAFTNLSRYGAENVYASEHGKRAIRATMRERYGVDHALQHPEMQERRRKTTRKRFGVDYAIQNHKVFAHQQRRMAVGAYAYKHVVLGGRSIDVQGWEAEALRYLVEDRGRDPASIRVSADETIRAVPYRFLGRYRYYHPDAAIGDTMIEVKSTYTLYGARNELAKNQAKAAGCRARGLRFVLLLVLGSSGHLRTVALPRRWETMRRDELVALVDQLRQRRAYVVHDGAVARSHVA